MWISCTSSWTPSAFSSYALALRRSILFTLHSSCWPPPSQVVIYSFRFHPQRAVQSEYCYSGRFDCYLWNFGWIYCIFDDQLDCARKIRPNSFDNCMRFSLYRLSFFAVFDREFDWFHRSHWWFDRRTFHFFGHSAEYWLEEQNIHLYWSWRNSGNESYYYAHAFFGVNDLYCCLLAGKVV